MGYLKKTFALTAAVGSLALFKYSQVKASQRLFEEAFKVERNDPEDHCWLLKMPYETIHLDSHDHLKLKGIYLPRDHAKFTMVIIHGYHSDAFRMSEYAKAFYETFDCDLFLPHLRGHGQSEGNTIGYGWLDKEDMKDWLVKLHEKNPGRPIVVFGLSMGAGCVNFLSCEQVVDEVKCYIEDCGYSSIYEELDYQCRKKTHLPLKVFAKDIDYLMKKYAGYSLRDGDGLYCVSHAKKPMMFIHGLSDDVVPSEMVFDLYNACRSEKQLFFVKNARHAHSLSDDRKAYLDVMKQFIEQYL